MLVQKYTETIEYVQEYTIFLRKIQTLRLNKLRILRIKNVKMSGYEFYLNMYIYRDFQNYIRALLTPFPIGRKRVQYEKKPCVSNCLKKV